MGKNNTALPKNWPQNLLFLTEPTKSPKLNSDQLIAIKQPSQGLAALPPDLGKGPSPLVKITPITSPGHPAYGQCGLFATRHLPPGSLIIPYYGMIHSSFPPHNEIHKDSDYDLWLDRDSGLAIDADKAGNEARFVNDYRGVKDRPNAEFKDCWDSRRGERCMAFFVLPAGKNSSKKGGGGIAKGEEILVSYGKGFWGERKTAEAEEGREDVKVE